MDIQSFLPYLNKTSEKYLKRVQSEIKYCEYCQSYDGGCVWVIGQKTTLDEILSECDIPQKYWDIICPHLSCPSCGNTGFDPYQDIGLENEYDLIAEKILKDADKKYGKSIQSFETHIQMYPSLTLCHALGRKIYKEINKGIIPITEASGVWFRAKRVRNGKILYESDVKAPQKEDAYEGRYNYAGQTVLYLANEKEVAAQECLGKIDESGIVWIQEFVINGIDKILNLKNDWDELDYSNALIVALLSSNILERKVDNRELQWKPQYYATRFISDCARIKNLKGIQYNSSRSYGTNLVIFEPVDYIITPEGKPYLYTYEPYSPRILQVSI